MSVLTFTVFLLIGKLVIFLLRKAPYFKRGAFLTQLFDCELCLGVWVYSALALVFHLNALEPFYVLVLSEVLTGAVMSFTMWIFTEGWNAKFRELHITME